MSASSALVLASIISWAADVGAVEAPPPAPPAASPAVQPQPNPSGQGAPRGPDDRREVPDYDGREEPTSAGDVLIWVPRVVLFPLYVVSEYVVRRPLGWLVSTAEREHWPALIIDFFTFGEEQQGGIVPTFLVDFGMRPSIGVYAFWNDFIVAGNDLRFRAAYGGERLYQLRVVDRFALGAGTFSMLGAFESRPDNVFYGLGRDASDERSRYYARTSRAELAYQLPWVRSSRARVGVELRQVDLDGDRRCCGAPSVDDQVAAGVFDAPPGMNQVFDVASQSLELTLDNRYPRFPEQLELASDYVTPPGNGARLALRGRVAELMDQSLAPDRALADGWVNYGASLGGYFDPSGEQRSLSATAIVDFVDPVGSGEVPITDLISLGGERPLRGFLANRFVDRSAAALRLEYRWPVAVWLDGSLTYEAGSVFGRHLSGFDLGDMRSSFGFGLAAVGAQDHPFQVLVALGTESYADGANVDSFRFVFGTTAGF